MSRIGGYLRKRLGVDDLQKEIGRLQDNIRALAGTQAQLHEQLADRIGYNESLLSNVAKWEIPTQLRDLGAVVQSAQADAEAGVQLGRRQLEWARDTARMLADMRAELRLLLEATAPPDKMTGEDSGDPTILRQIIDESNIRELYPTELFERLAEIELPLLSINEESGHSNQVDLLYVAAIAKLVGAANIFEFGTYIGRTTYGLSLASTNARVTTLNLPPEEDPRIAESLGRLYKGTEREGQISQLLGDSKTFDPTPYTGSMDFVFVDADHGYESVKNDSEKALVMLRPGGLVVWHDFSVRSPGVIRYLSELSRERSLFRLKHTCLVVYLDGVDASAFQPAVRMSARSMVGLP